MRHNLTQNKIESNVSGTFDKSFASFDGWRE